MSWPHISRVPSTITLVVFFFFFSGPQDHETHSQDTGAAGLRSNFLTPSKTPVRWPPAFLAGWLVVGSFFLTKWMDCGLSKVFQSNLEKAKNASKEEEHNSIHCFSTWPLQSLGICLSWKPVSRDLSPKGTEDRGHTLNEGTYCLYRVMCVRVFPPPWRCSVVWEKKWGQHGATGQAWACFSFTDNCKPPVRPRISHPDSSHNRSPGIHQSWVFAATNIPQPNSLKLKLGQYERCREILYWSASKDGLSGEALESEMTGFGSFPTTWLSGFFKARLFSILLLLDTAFWQNQLLFLIPSGNLT